jgi:hypothetical protein
VVDFGLQITHNRNFENGKWIHYLELGYKNETKLIDFNCGSKDKCAKI